MAIVYRQGFDGSLGLPLIDQLPHRRVLRRQCEPLLRIPPGGFPIAPVPLEDDPSIRQ